jgi:AcrR family transcriptional regulator
MTQAALPRGRAARTRAKIIASAAVRFADGGFDRTTIGGVAADAGVSVGAVYVHFGSKAELIAALVHEQLDILDSWIAEARTAESPMDRVLCCGDEFLRFCLRYPVPLRLGQTRGFEPSVSPDDRASDDALAARVRGMLIGLAVDLKAAMDAGEIESIPIDEALVLVWSTWHGVASLALRRDALVIPPELAQRSLALARTLLLAQFMTAPSDLQRDHGVTSV